MRTFCIKATDVGHGASGSMAIVVAKDIKEAIEIYFKDGQYYSYNMEIIELSNLVPTSHTEPQIICGIAIAE